MKTDSKFIKKYIDRMSSIMMRTNPDWDKKKIEKVLLELIEEDMVNPSVELDNNYTGEHKESTLLSIFDWSLDRKPIICGNGTFYKNQHEALNPVAKMLDDMAAKRKALKKLMFKAGEEFGEESEQYKDLDRGQNNEKINMNSYYGASGAKSSAFYSKWSGPATTLSAQSVISTAECFFESFLADNYIYINLTELMEWMMVVLKENVILDDFVILHTREELMDKLLDKILQPEYNDEEILYNFLLSLTDEEITVLYYKNNMIEFIKDNEYIQELFIEVFENVKNLEYVDDKDEDWLSKIPSEYTYSFSGKEASDWNKFVNKTYFMDPNEPPNEIIDRLNILSAYLMKYCLVKYLAFDRIYRLRNFERMVATVIDTDSNFLSIDTLINFLFEKVIRYDGYDRSIANNEYIAVNTLTYIISLGINEMLLFYGEKSNIPEEFRDYYNMKNEFFDSLLVIGKSKKRYISNQVLREGNLLKPEKIDIKGFDFKKASCSEYSEMRFMKIIKDRIVNGGEISIKGMIEDVRDFREEIYTSIKNRETTFLPNGNAKELAGYANPGSIQSVRAVLAWNLLEPDNQIELPAKVKLLKMNIFTEKSMEPLKDTNPEMYDIIMDKIFDDKTGIFVSSEWDPGLDYVNVRQREWWKNIPKKYRSKYKKLGPVKWNEFVDEALSGENPKYDLEKDGKYIYKKKGLQVLAIPSNASIPEWCEPYIDYSTMVNNIIAPFKPVLEIFGSKFAEEGKTINSVNRKTETLTNIIKF